MWRTYSSRTKEYTPSLKQRRVIPLKVRGLEQVVRALYFSQEVFQAHGPFLGSWVGVKSRYMHEPAFPTWSVFKTSLYLLHTICYLFLTKSVDEFNFLFVPQKESRDTNQIKLFFSFHMINFSSWRVSVSSALSWMIAKRSLIICWVSVSSQIHSFF